MTLPVWPADLPKPARAGYKAQMLDPRLRRKAETGPPGYRRRYSSVGRNVGLTFDFTRAQKAAFDRFYEQTTSHGTLPFEMPDPVTDGWLLLTETGQPIETILGDPMLLSATWVCQFGDTTPVETIRGVRFLVSLNVVVMP